MIYEFIINSKHAKEYVVGQENLYEDPCDEWLDLVNNKLTSPNFPKAYESRTECKWNVTAPQGHYVTLDFESIDVSNNTEILFLTYIILILVSCLLSKSFHF